MGIVEGMPQVRLTIRQKHVWELLAKGMTDKEIAAKLGTTPLAVRGQLRGLFENLRVRNRVEATLRFHGLI